MVNFNWAKFECQLNSLSILSVNLLLSLGTRSRLVANLELAVGLLDNAYKLGLVSLKESVITALRLAGEEPVLEEDQKIDLSLINGDVKTDPWDGQYSCDQCDEICPTFLELEKHAKSHKE